MAGDSISVSALSVIGPICEILPFHRQANETWELGVQHCGRHCAEELLRTDLHAIWSRLFVVGPDGGPGPA